MTTLVFRVPGGYSGSKLSAFLRAQGMAMGLVRSVKYTPGGLVVNGQPARTNRVLAAGDEVCVQLPAAAGYSAVPQAMALDILCETPQALVLNKPAGLVMHPTRSHAGGTLANGVCALWQARGSAHTFRPVGRLDADTSGAVLCALNEFAAPHLAQSLEKSYLALVGGTLAGSGCIDAPLGPAQDSVIRQCVRADGRKSLTEYEVLAALQGAALVRVWPRTGRTHQIRAHFAHIGHPLLGDGLYGGDFTYLSRHALHCETLRFTQPQVLLQSAHRAHNTGGGVVVHCALAPDMQRALWALGLAKDSTKMYNTTNRVMLV